MAEKNKKMDFEQKLAKLEEISKILSDPATDLQEAIKLYEDGMKISAEVDKELSKIERRIEIVTSQPGESSEGVIVDSYNE